MNEIAINFSEFIQIQNNQTVTTSEFVAKAFKKNHKNVLAKIDEILTQVPDFFGKLNFKPTENSYKNNLGFDVTTRVYELTKDGFMLLVMGFTGKQAMQIKIAYIEAFNKMAETLKNTLPHQGKDVWQMMGECFAADAKRRDELPPARLPMPSESISREMFDKIARMVAYASSWRDIQKMMCDNPKEFMASTSLYNTNPNETGFLFVFKPDVENDIKFMANWLKVQAAYLD